MQKQIQKNRVTNTAQLIKMWKNVGHNAICWCRISHKCFIKKTDKKPCLISINIVQEYIGTI